MAPSRLDDQRAAYHLHAAKFSAPSGAVFVNVAVDPTPLVASGRNAEGEATVPGSWTYAVAIVGGGAPSLALKANGTVVAWSWNAEKSSSLSSGSLPLLRIASWN
ncbi:MAG: hypothetical protein HY736_07895 [Verrucomicrobia bacterium]|nr:hypothetical protein [Verrucomicrobiota bacterium]